MNAPPDTRKNSLSGLFFALAACAAWGVIPLYWNLLAKVSPVEILAHRVLWSFAFALVLTRVVGLWDEFRRVLKTRRLLGTLLLSSLLIGSNWLIFIAAIQWHRLSEASLGYFLSPLTSVALGVFVLRERLGRLQFVSVVLAACGALFLIVRTGSIPWISILLPTTFAAYSLLRKRAPVSATVGLLMETLVLSPVALVLVILQLVRSNGSLPHDVATHVLLMAAGPLTALPLMWFARAARALPLSVLGPLQYISPTLQLLTALFVFGESISTTRWVAFSFIWAALLLFAGDVYRSSRRVDVQSR